MPESKGYQPEELIEQEGPEKGNISDPELAQIGAEAEDAKRAEFPIVDDVDRREGYGNQAGMRAVRDEVIERTEEAKGTELTDDEKRMTGFEFEKEQNQKKGRDFRAGGLKG